MKESIDVNWTGGLSFETELDGHRIVMDASPNVGGNDKGPRPKAMLMVSLAGCTGMDVASILKKMKVEVESFTVKVEGETMDIHPKYYISMHLVYLFKGKDLPMDKLKRAVELSQETYCGVSATLKNSMKLSYEIKVTD